ncbi:hypothetical protein [Streptomyces sp. NBC_00038]|uniref:hypothetical protein n=1 Tax=Streptomyces sp. NBC_00038 TaxID=2903615 RepID=UPI0022552446|nr:hypothetical protein [Streptomyces sp. NBC_00038]MCX5554863.1 hypothetical protein [Streptomyces sp. NBC_00038]
MEGTGLEGHLSADRLDTRSMITAPTGAVGRMSCHSPGESIYRYINRMVLRPPETELLAMKYTRESERNTHYAEEGEPGER